MVSKELTKAAGLENIFKTINKANNIQLAIITVFVEGFNAGMKAAQTSFFNTFIHKITTFKSNYTVIFSYRQ